MSGLIGKGLLRHRFHGAYTAILVLGFDTPEAATAALAIVGEPFAVTTDPRALVAVFAPNTLEAFKATHAARIEIAPCGWKHCHPRAKGSKGPCRATAIDAITHSIDVGPEFTFNAGALQPRQAPRKRSPRKVRPVLHNACTIERRKRVTHESLSLATGEATAVGEPTWETVPCDAPLFNAVERHSGACSSCYEGWTHDHNYPTEAGRKAIEAARAEVARAVSAATAAEVST